MDYLLLTVARDEAEHLPQVLAAVRQQTLAPTLWLTVDDGSSDTTGELLRGLDGAAIFERREHPTRDIGFHWGEVLSQSAARLMALADERGVAWDVLAIVEGDAAPAPDYFATLAAALAEDPQLGIVSGELVEPGAEQPVGHRRDIPWGAATLYRRACLEDIHGFSPTPSHESVEIVLAQARGWRTAIVAGTRFVHLRPMGSAGSWYRGHVEMGRAARWLGLPLSFAAAKALRLTLGRHPTRGAGYLRGYLGWRGGRCELPEVRAVYRRRWREWWRRG